MEAESSQPSQGQLYPGSSDNFLILTLFLSAVTFGLLNVALIWVLPMVITLGQTSQWRFRNLAVSFVHASMSAILCFYCYFSYEGQLSSLHDMVISGSDATYIVVTISIGYFLYDLMDYVIQGKALSTLEITVHHFAMIFGMGYTVVNRYSIWYSILSLTVETNSSFLHLRKMLQVAGVPALSWTYTVVKVLNVLTFVYFRGQAQILIWAGLLTHLDVFSYFFSALIFCIMIFMLIMNPIFLWRLVHSDFINLRKKRKEKSTGDANGNIGTEAAPASVSEKKTKAKVN